MLYSLTHMTVKHNILIRLHIAEWDDDMTYLYVDYPFYKKYLIYLTIASVNTLIDSNNVFFYRDFSFTTITSFSTIETCNSPPSALLVWSSSHQMLSTLNTENKSWDAISLTSTFKWEQMSSSRKENPYWEVKKWRNGSGLQLIFKRLSWELIDNHSRMMLLISLTLSYCCKTLSEDTLMIHWRSHLQLEVLELESERGLREIWKGSQAYYRCFNLNIIFT